MTTMSVHHRLTEEHIGHAVAGKLVLKVTGRGWWKVVEFRRDGELVLIPAEPPNVKA